MTKEKPQIFVVKTSPETVLDDYAKLMAKNGKLDLIPPYF
jgi:hypothetical protein